MQMNVSTSLVVIAEGSAAFLIKNRTATTSVFLETGNTAGAVSASNGFEWQVSDPPLDIELQEGEVLFGVVAAGQATRRCMC